MPDISYEVYKVEREHVREEGNLQIPTTGIGTPPQVVCLHAPVEMLKVTFEIGCHGDAPPEMPAAATFEPNLVFLRGVRTGLTPLPKLNSNDQAKVWIVRGTYFYALKKNEGFDTAMPTGKVPYTAIDAGANVIPAANFRKDLVGTKKY